MDTLQRGERKGGLGMKGHAFRELAVAMLRTGLVGYGGGPAILPLMRHEAVTRYGWLDDTEFGEIVAVANTLPGPIATKIASYLGYRQAGFIGALVAVLANILPTTVAIVALLSLMTVFHTSPVVHGMIEAVSPVIAIMLGGMAYDFLLKAKKGLAWPLTCAFVAITLILLIVLKLPDAVVVLLFLVYGAMHLRVVALVKASWRDGKGELK